LDTSKDWMNTGEDGLSQPLAFRVATSGSSSERPIESK